MATDYLATFRQTIPRLRQVVRAMNPTFRMPDVLGITHEFLRNERIRAVLWDVDGTLMSYHALSVDAKFADHLHGLMVENPDIRHGVLSNCDEQRFIVLATIFPKTPILRGYRTRQGPVLRVRFGATDTHTPTDLTALWEAGASQIRKPDHALIELTAQHLDLAPDDLLMVGDQYLTDVAVANLGGCRSVKVPTFRPDTFPNTIKVSQAVERTLFRVAYGSS